MCDITTKNRELITYNEPNALIWAVQNCNGAQTIVSPGEYKTLDGTNVGRNNIDSMWIPPNMEMDVYNGPDFTEASATYKGGLYTDLNNPRINNVGINSIDSLKLRRTKPWTDHLISCCMGDVVGGASPEKCGTYWGKGNNAMGLCDSLMETYCKAHPSDEKCSCYSMPEKPDDPIEVKVLKANPKCWSQTCSVSGYMPSNLVNQQCPNIKICKQDISALGTNNIVQNNLYVQDCSDRTTNGGTGSAPPPTQPDEKTTAQLAIEAYERAQKEKAAAEEARNMRMLLIFIVVVCVLFGINYMMDSDTPVPYAYGPQPYGPQPYGY